MEGEEDTSYVVVLMMSASTLLLGYCSTDTVVSSSVVGVSSMATMHSVSSLTIVVVFAVGCLSSSYNLLPWPRLLWYALHSSHSCHCHVDGEENDDSGDGEGWV